MLQQAPFMGSRVNPDNARHAGNDGAGMTGRRAGRLLEADVATEGGNGLRDNIGAPIAL